MAFDIEIRDISWVQRWNILRRSRNQSVAEHSYYVTVYSAEIAEMICWGGDVAALLKYAMVHDAFEAREGDQPSPMKHATTHVSSRLHQEDVFFWQILPTYGRWWRRVERTHDYCAEQELPTETPEVLREARGIQAIVHVADLFEACLWLAEESRLGNTFIGSFHRAEVSPSRDLYLGLRRSIDRLREFARLGDLAWNGFVASVLDGVDKPIRHSSRIMMRNQES